MEEKEVIQIEILSQSHPIKRGDFVNFNGLVKKQQFNQMKIPFIQLNDQKIHILNIFLYYIISIQKKIRVFKEDQFGDKYRGVCTKAISDYYIKNKMVIQLYEFAFLSAKVLAMKVEQCAHIIYYLIYGRFASHPYINSLCGKNDYDFKRKIFKKGRQTFDNLRMTKKRTINPTKSHTELQMDMFCKQLKHTLKCQNGNTVNWKKQIDKRHQSESKKKQNQNKQSFHATERKTSSHGYNFNTFIPQRIAQDQNSSILESLPFQRKSYQTCTEWNKKGLMRKQKFNQFFDIQQYKLKSGLKKTPLALTQSSNNKENNHLLNIQNNRNTLFQLSNNGDLYNSATGSGKINYQNFKNISNELKVKNYNLDKIREQCAIRNQHNGNGGYNNNIDSKQQINQLNICCGNNNFVEVKKDMNIDKNFKEVKIFQSKTIDKVLVLTDQQAFNKISLRRNFSTAEGLCLKDLTLTKNFSYQPQRNFDQVDLQVQEEKSGQYTTNLLRNDESLKQKQNEQIKKLGYFSQASVGFKKMNCKYKLQKYKSDYRKFMKTQLLDRIRQAS